MILQIYIFEAPILIHSHIRNCRWTMLYTWHPSPYPNCRRIHGRAVLAPEAPLLQPGALQGRGPSWRSSRHSTPGRWLKANFGGPGWEQLMTSHDASRDASHLWLYVPCTYGHGGSMCIVCWYVHRTILLSENPLVALHVSVCLYSSIWCLPVKFQENNVCMKPFSSPLLITYMRDHGVRRRATLFTVHVCSIVNPSFESCAQGKASRQSHLTVEALASWDSAGWLSRKARVAAIWISQLWSMRFRSTALTTWSWRSGNGCFLQLWTVHVWENICI